METRSSLCPAAGRMAPGLRLWPLAGLSPSVQTLSLSITPTQTAAWRKQIFQQLTERTKRELESFRHYEQAVEQVGLLVVCLLGVFSLGIGSHCAPTPAFNLLIAQVSLVIQLLQPPEYWVAAFSLSAGSCPFSDCSAVWQPCGREVGRHWAHILSRASRPQEGSKEKESYSSILKNFSQDPATFRTPCGPWECRLLKGGGEFALGREAKSIDPMSPHLHSCDSPS